MVIWFISLYYSGLPLLFLVSLLSVGLFEDIRTY